MGTTNDSAVRVVDLDKGIIEGLAIPFGGPIAGKDFYDTAFTKNTDFHLEWFPDGRPLLYDHGTDIKLGGEPIGKQISVRETELGMWAEAQINRANEYAEMLLQLAEQGLMGFSSGSIGRHVNIDTKGEIMTWPWIELSVTPTPANPYAMISPSATIDNIRSLGIENVDPIAIRALRDADKAKERSLGRILLRIRDERGLTNADLAESAGLDMGNMVSIMSGALICPSVEKIESLARALDCNPERLIGAAMADGCEYESKAIVLVQEIDPEPADDDATDNTDTSEPEGDEPAPESTEGAESGEDSDSTRDLPDELSGLAARVSVMEKSVSGLIGEFNEMRASAAVVTAEPEGDESEPEDEITNTEDEEIADETIRAWLDSLKDIHSGVGKTEKE